MNNQETSSTSSEPPPQSSALSEEPPPQWPVEPTPQGAYSLFMLCDEAVSHASLFRPEFENQNRVALSQAMNPLQRSGPVAAMMDSLARAISMFYDRNLKLQSQFRQLWKTFKLNFSFVAIAELIVPVAPYQPCFIANDRWLADSKGSS